MENTLFSIEKGRAMEGAMEDRPSTHTLTMIFGRELWRITYGGKKILHRILQKTPSMEINKRPKIFVKNTARNRTEVIILSEIKLANIIFFNTLLSII